MKRFITIIFSLILFASYANAQDVSQQTNYMFLKETFNPAAIAIDDRLNISALYRNQWLGIEGNPTLQILSFSSPLNIANSSIGFLFLNELQGAERNTHFRLAYAYNQKLQNGRIVVGVSGGVIQKSIDGSKLRAPEGSFDSDGNYQGHKDDRIPEKMTSSIAPDLNLGIFLGFKKLELGLSANNLIEGRVNYKTDSSNGTLRFSRHYVFTAGYRFNLNRKLNLQAHVLLKTDFIKVQADYSMLVQYNDNIYGGVAFRGSGQNMTDALSVLFGFKVLKKVRIGYSYDFSISSLNDANSGSHEVYINYSINLRDLANPGKVIYNPRFL